MAPPAGTPRRIHPLVPLAIGLAAVSHSAILVRLADAHPVVIACGRLAVAALILCPLAFALERRAWHGLPRGVVVRVGLAGLCLALHFVTWIASLDRTSIADSVVLVSLTPVWIALVSVALTRRAPPRHVAFSVLLAVAGSAVIAFGSAGRGGSKLEGDALALAGGLFIAGYLLLGQSVQRHLPFLSYVSGCYGVAAVVLGLVIAVLGVQVGGLGVRTYAAIAALGLVCQVVGHSSFNWGLRRFSSSFIAVFLLGEPLLGAILGVVYFAEIPTTTTIIGGMITLAGLYLGAVGELRR